MKFTVLHVVLHLIAANVILGENDTVTSSPIADQLNKDKDDEILINSELTNQFEDEDEEIVNIASKKDAIDSQQTSVATQNLNSEQLHDRLWRAPNSRPPFAIVYTIDLADEDDIKLIHEVIDEYQSDTPITCIEFFYAEDESLAPFVSKYWLKFTESTSGECEFPFGKTSDLPEILLHSSCMTRTELMRGIGHTLGIPYPIYSEDAEDYVTVNHENGDLNLKTVAKGLKYDYASLLHPNGFWKSNNSRLTISTKDIRHQGLLGRAQKLSFYDKKNFNELYGCHNYWLEACGTSKVPCQNEGYQGPLCICECPKESSTIDCSDIKLDEDRYSSLLPNCSQDIEKHTEINNYNKDVNISFDTWCVWRIKAPEGEYVKLKFNNFELYSDDDCKDSFLEIREQNMTYGDLYCNTSLEEAEHVSEGNELYLYMDVRNDISLGFQADICFLTGKSEECKSSASRIKSNGFILIICFVLLCLQLQWPQLFHHCCLSSVKVIRGFVKRVFINNI